MGLKLEGEPNDFFAVWPENWPPVLLFNALATQWRLTPMGQRAGLDYAAIPALLRLKGVPRADWPDLFDALQVIEREFLKAVQ